MLEIKFTPYGMDVLRRTPMLVQKIVRETGNLALRIMLKHIPYKSGFLRTSTAVHEIGKLYLKVAPTAVYARAVDQGMPGAPGRYVPAIGKRLTRSGRGWWPGFKGHYYIQDTFMEMTRQVPAMIRRIIFDHFAGG